MKTDIFIGSEDTHKKEEVFSKDGKNLFNLCIYIFKIFFFFEKNPTI